MCKLQGRRLQTELFLTKVDSMAHSLISRETEKVSFPDVAMHASYKL